MLHGQVDCDNGGIAWFRVCRYIQHWSTNRYYRNGTEELNRLILIRTLACVQFIIVCPCTLNGQPVMSVYFVYGYWSLLCQAVAAFSILMANLNGVCLVIAHIPSICFGNQLNVGIVLYWRRSTIHLFSAWSWDIPVGFGFSLLLPYPAEHGIPDGPSSFMYNS